MQGEHFRHPDTEGLPVLGRQQGPGGLFTTLCFLRNLQMGPYKSGRLSLASHSSLMISIGLFTLKCNFALGLKVYKTFYYTLK
jgi:hypothetical protein